MLELKRIREANVILKQGLRKRGWSEEKTVTRGSGNKSR